MNKYYRHLIEEGMLLDIYPNAAAAYSLRKLRNSYTGSANRARRSNDNAEQNSFDSSTLLSFVGANNGFNTTWYDQANSNNATQTIASNQPILVSIGSLITSGGLQAVQGGSTLGTRTGTITLNSASFFWFFLVVDVSNNTTSQTLFETSANFNTNNGAINCFIQSGVINLGQRISGSKYSIKTYPVTIGRHLISGFFRTGQTAANASKIFIDGAEVNGTVTFNNTSVALTNQIVSLFARNGNTNGFLGKYQEAVFYLSDQSLNRNQIEQEINNYYGIY